MNNFNRQFKLKKKRETSSSKIANIKAKLLINYKWPGFCVYVYYTQINELNISQRFVLISFKFKRFVYINIAKTLNEN